MSDRFLIDMFGDRELAESLRLLPPNLERTVIRKVLKNGAEKVAMAARSKTKRSTKRRYKTGMHLADSIFVGRLRSVTTVGGKRLKGRVGFKVQTGRRSELGIPEGNTGYYPFSLEFGFRHAKSGQFISANPYLKPALEENRSRVIAEMSSELRIFVDQHITRFTRKFNRQFGDLTF